MKVEYELGITS